MTQAGAATRAGGLRSGDSVLVSIVLADFLGAIAGALVHLTMVWWVLEQGVPGPVVSLLVLCIFLPLNLGVLLTGVAVERYGSRRLLILSKLIATGGALACFALLATGAMTLIALGIIAILTYAAMAPSVAADIARVPALTRLAGRRLESFHATNGIGMVLGQLGGLMGAGLLWDTAGPAAAVGLGVGFILASVALTWLGFPRDRLAPRSPLSALSRILDLSRKVIGTLDGPRIGLPAVLATAAIIATAQGCIEVAFPIAVAAADLPPSALSLALVLAVGTGVAASFTARGVYARVRLAPALLAIAVALFAVLLVAAQWPGITGFYIAVGVTSAAAAGSGTLTITALQYRMPASLQAQAIGLWQCLVLAVGSLTILATGMTGEWSLWFIAAIALCAVILSGRAVRLHPARPVAE